MYIDSHAHLFYEDYGEELADVLQRAADAGVEKIVVPGTTLETSKIAVELAQKHRSLFACVGFHPHEASKATDAEFSEIENLCREPEVVAIGEIGLDYHYDFAPRNRQLEVFKKQIQIAIRQKLPIVVHTRESMKEALEIVREYCGLNPQWMSETKNGGRGVFHCFSGNASEANEPFKLGFLVSYPGMVTFKNSPVVDTLRTIGIRRVMLETDSPFLAPVPMRGRRNEPSLIGYTAKKVAEVLELGLEEVASVTTENAMSLFNLEN